MDPSEIDSLHRKNLLIPTSLMLITEPSQKNHKFLKLTELLFNYTSKYVFTVKSEYLLLIVIFWIYQCPKTFMFFFKNCKNL